jgi:AmmeMemoRadiSam system protein B
MNKYFTIFFLIFFVSSVITADSEILTREYHNDYGFTSGTENLKQVIELCEKLEKETLAENMEKYTLDKDSAFSAAICPHDDYAYAGRVYINVLPYIKAKTVIIFGVAHKARNFGLKDKMIFDSFDNWDTVMGPIPVSPLRDKMIKKLHSDSYTINNKFMLEEHSIEALTHWLKYLNPDVEIIPICIPYMDWNRMKLISHEFAGFLSEEMKTANLKFGRDIAVLISNDSSHYGDQGWGGKNYDDFGSDVKGFIKATERDRMIAKKYLGAKLTCESLQNFLYLLVDERNVENYKITWCGRFCIPFGLATYIKINKLLGNKIPPGKMLRYDTSVNLGILEPLDKEPQVTAPANLHHWVGYLALGY